MLRLQTLITALDLPTRTKNALSNAGIKYLEDVYNYNELTILKTKGFGKKGLNKIKEILVNRGMTPMDKGA